MKKSILFAFILVGLIQVNASDLIRKIYLNTTNTTSETILVNAPIYLVVESNINLDNAEVSVQQNQNNEINIDLRYNKVSYRQDFKDYRLGSLEKGDYKLTFTLAQKGSDIIDTTIVLNFKVEDLPSMLLDINRCWALMEEDGTTYKQAFSNNTIEADGKQYRCEKQGLYAYREEDGKLYEYSIKDKSERLVFDTNLKTGDKLALAEGLSLEVEAMSDTMILYSIDVLLAPDTYEVSYDSIFAKYRRWHLRGVENPKYTDTWVEHVGSMKYGIHFPNLEQESRFLYSFLLDEDFCIYTNTFNSDYCNAFSIDMKDGHEMEGSRPSTYLKYTNENGNLRIKGYVKSQGGPIYAIMNMANETEIHINPFEYLPPRYEGTVEDSVNFTLPGTYPQADYQIYFGEHLVKEAGKADNEIVFLPDGDKYSRTFSFAYDMSGFDLTDTYGGGEDKAWVIYAAQRYNWSYSDDMRKPAIPYLHYKILLPDGFKLKDFSYNCDSFCLASNITLATNEAANVLSGYYGFDVLHSESIMDGYTIADISIAPFAYDADKRNLYMASMLHLNITIAETSTEDVYHSGDMDDVIKTAIYNLEDFGKGTAPWEGTVSLPILSQESAESIWYDLRGRRVTAPESESIPADGIYISKDKKILYRKR